jgi:hypothetical protein
VYINEEKEEDEEEEEEWEEEWDWERERVSRRGGHRYLWWISPSWIKYIQIFQYSEKFSHLFRTHLESMKILVLPRLLFSGALLWKQGCSIKQIY